MRARLIVGGLLALFALLAAPAALAAGPYPPPSSSSGSVDPGRIRHGECATFTGNGFTPGESIVITDNGVPIGTATADSQGRFSYRYCPSSSARPGRHVLGARGNGSGTYVTAVVVITGVQQSANQPVSGQGADGAGAGNGAGGGPLALTGLPVLVIAAVGTAFVTLGAFLLLVADRKDRRRRRSALAA